MSGDSKTYQLRPRVEQGDVQVTGIDIVRQTPDIIILNVQTDAKRPAFGAYSPGTMFTLWPENYADLNGNYAQTVVTLGEYAPGTGDWGMVMQSGRYDVEVVLWREPHPDEYVTVFPMQENDRGE